jgi:hypothetical protein
MYPRIRNTPVLDAIRAYIAGWVLGRRLWTKMYRFHTESAWKMGAEGQPLPWKDKGEAER